MPQADPVPYAGTILSEQITRDYRIVRRLGRGGMGDVYLAEQLRVGNRPIALKVLNRACADNPQVIKRFEAEAATAGLIQHRNVVTIYESRITEDGQIYVAMEYLHGKTLREVMLERRLALSEMVEITRQVCAGLAAAHKLGIVHRDIKPDNLMLVREDDHLVVKILDFGIARLSETQAFSMHTNPGAVLGTPAYMSPEQAAGAIGEQIDARSDIYSLAMVVYEMLSGRVAFASESWPVVLHQHLYEPPPPPSTLSGGLVVPPQIEQVVMRALAKDRKQRPTNALEFSQELTAAYAQVNTLSASATEPLRQAVQTPVSNPQVTAPVAATPAERPHTLGGSAQVTTSPAPDKKSNVGLLAGVALAVCLLAGAAFWFLRAPSNSADPAGATGDSAAQTAVSGARSEVAEFQIKRRDPVEGLTTLTASLTAQPAERLLFTCKPAQDAAVYLFEEKASGAWSWLDATTDGRAPVSAAGQWLEVPRTQWYVVDDSVPQEKFWLVLVPHTVEWSLPALVAPAPLTISQQPGAEGTVPLSPESSAKLLTWLRQNGAPLSAESRANGDAVTWQFWQAGETPRVAYHQITLKHAAKE